MNHRTLGRTGLKVSEVGYGAWGIGAKQWIGATDEESTKALDRAIDLGLNFIDTALAYGDGHSEKIVGQVVRRRKGKVLVATKIPPKNRRWPAERQIPVDQVYTAEYDQLGGEPYAALLGLYEFANDYNDRVFLKGMASLCKNSHAPFIASAAPWY